MGIDTFPGAASLSSQGESWATIAPNDGATLAKIPKGIFCGTAGTVKMEGADGVAVTFTVPAGMILNLRPTKIWANGTTVTELTGIY